MNCQKSHPASETCASLHVFFCWDDPLQNRTALILRPRQSLERRMSHSERWAVSMLASKKPQKIGILEFFLQTQIWGVIYLALWPCWATSAVLNSLKSYLGDTPSCFLQLTVLSDHQLQIWNQTVVVQPCATCVTVCARAVAVNSGSLGDSSSILNVAAMLLMWVAGWLQLDLEQRNIFGRIPLFFSQQRGSACNEILGGGFKYFSFSPLFGEDSHFD